MQLAICLLSAIPMRKEPSHRSEMVSQILFGEYATTGEEKDDFVLVQCDYDSYAGWVQKNQLTPVEEKRKAAAFTSAFSTAVAKNDTMLYVPYGSPVYGQNDFRFSAAGFNINYLLQPQQVWKAGELALSLPTLQAVYQPYLNAPYLWGGKSVFGTDCSGFVQQVFKLFGVTLLRDAYLQAEQGTSVSSLSEAVLGDLAFFCNEGGRVTHVGIVLDEGKIVHASGQVRIDVLDKEGIMHSETRKRTHTLQSIRRFFDKQ